MQPTSDLGLCMSNFGESFAQVEFIYNIVCTVAEKMLTRPRTIVLTTLWVVTILWVNWLYELLVWWTDLTNSSNFTIQWLVAIVTGAQFSSLNLLAVVLECLQQIIRSFTCQNKPSYNKPAALGQSLSPVSLNCCLLFNSKHTLWQFF